MIFKLAKASERRSKDLEQLRCIKDEEGHVLVEEMDTERRRQRYFYKLLNKVTKSGIVLRNLEHFEDLRTFRYYRCITAKGVKEAISEMKRGRQ